MVVKHNISAMNSQRNLKLNQNKTAGNIEKLSSGYKINRSADNAAGLAISEKMRCTITGLEQGTENAEDGVGLVRTAEGALDEMHAMLNRLKELSVQSANGTYDDAVDRNAIQKEVGALVTEVDRIVESTNFNGIPLLNREGLEEKIYQVLIEGGEWIYSDSEIIPGYTIENGEKIANTYDYYANVEAPSNTIVNNSSDAVQYATTYKSSNFSVPSTALSIPANAELPYEVEMIITTYNDADSTEGNAVIENKVVTVRVTEENGVYSVQGTQDIVSGDDLASYDANDSKNWKEFNGLEWYNTSYSLNDNPSSILYYTKDFETTGVTTSEMQRIMDNLLNTMPDNLGTGGYITTTSPESMFLADPATWKAAGFNYEIVNTGTSSYYKWTSIPSGDSTSSFLDRTYTSSQKYALSSYSSSYYGSVYGSSMYVVGSGYNQEGRVLGVEITVSEDDAIKTTSETPSGFDPTEWISSTDMLDLTTSEVLGVAVMADPTHTELTLNGDNIMNGEELVEYLKTNPIEDYLITLSKYTVTSPVEGETVELTESFAIVFNPFLQEHKDLFPPGVVLVVADDDDTLHTKIDELCEKIQASSALNIASAKRKLDNDDFDLAIDDNETDCYTLQLSTYYQTQYNYKDVVVPDEILPSGEYWEDQSYWDEVIEPSTGPIILQVGDQNQEFDRVYVYIKNMRPDVETLRNVDASTQVAASNSIQIINDTINSVSSVRADLGAYDNRLQHTINKNRLTTENLQEAESKIRDADMAEEMMKYTKDNILIQSAQSMLSHAMSLPEGVLQLLG